MGTSNTRTRRNHCFGEHTAIERMPLAYEFSFDNHDWRTPTAFGQGFPPLIQSIANFQLNRNTDKFSLKRVINDIHC